MRDPLGRMLVLLIVATAVSLIGSGLWAQLGERPGNSQDNPIDVPKDLSGLSIKNPRVRVVHTNDPSLAGGSLYLQQADPWLGYKIGWSLTQREFRERDGVYGEHGKLDGIILPDGATKMMSRSHVNSCAVCHNVPFRDGGAGANIPKNGGEGRNTPHMFGAGLVEMIGQQMRLQALAQADENRDGWISRQEMVGKRCRLAPIPGGEVVDYGSFDDEERDGKPDLNPLFNPIYVDRNGKRMATARSLHVANVAGYTFEPQIFGFGHLYVPFRPPVSTTIRSFLATPFDIHSGLQACDPTTLHDPDGDGFAQVSNPGCLQCVTAAGKDRAATRGPTGLSLDDPDRDGYCEELTEGDLDMAEWYLLNHPAPARAKITPAIRRGEATFKAIGCASCHAPDWQLEPANPLAGDYTKRYDGDRRFFEIQVQHNDVTDRLEGRLAMLADKRAVRSQALALRQHFAQPGQRPASNTANAWIPRRAGYLVKEIYSDFKYHDVGEAFYQVQFDGSVVTHWRTPPLWGVGSTAPYGHDGANLTLDDVIRRHGGEALATRDKYAALTAEERRDLLEFLNNLVLYQTERLPCDVDGDGKITEHFIVGGMDTGVERCNPEWLFLVPGKVEGPVENGQGRKIVSFALTNVREAYGVELEYLRDQDLDGFPDVIDPAPTVRGYKDGRK